MRAGVLSDRIAEGAGAHAVDDRCLVEAGERSVVKVSIQNLERLLNPGAAQVE
jgi:hypothetical protein